MLSVFLRCFIFLSLFLTAQTFAALPAAELKPGHLFTMYGSNTLGARLAPTWAQNWLALKGAEDVDIHSLPIENEYRVQGLYNGEPVYIDVRAHGSSTGFRALMAGTTDIALASRHIKDAEVQQLKHLGNLRSFNAEHVVAIDGLAVIVHPNNKINKLSVADIGRVFSGEIHNWSVLGGSNRPITIYARDDNSGTWDTFKHLVLGSQYTLAKSAQRFESNDDLSDHVSSDPGAIGFVGLASVRDAKALAINDTDTSALRPEIVYVATEDYPLTRRLFMYTPEKIANPFVEEFIDFANSQRGQQIVNKIGFVSQNPIKLKIENSEGPEAYQDLAQYAERLSINFRFKGSDANLDNKALRDISRLSSYAKANEQQLRVQLVGFSNTRDTEQRADVLSRLRASAVKIALFKEGIVSEPVLGYGADVLVANSSGDSSIKNNRVEVWVFDEKAKTQFAKNKNKERYASTFSSSSVQ